MNADSIRTALQCGNAGCSCHRGPNVHCPAHQDKAPSLTVHEAADGRVLVNCKTGCKQSDVIDALKGRGLWATHEPTEPHTNGNGKVARPTEEPTAIYEYRDASGDLMAIKARFEYSEGRKSFKWKLPKASSWSGLEGLPMSEMPLWGVELLRDVPLQTLIYFVEGEKACLACRAKGLTAVTHGGGASTTDFGESLQALRSRNIALWPDNDEAGRRYMARVHAALRPIAKAVTVLNPSVPEKGDAHDFFGAGGTMIQLLKGIPPSKPVVDFLSHDSLRVRMPSALGTIDFTFTGMEKTSRELDCELEISLDAAGEPVGRRLNMLSGSQITDLRRDLEAIFGKDLGWTQTLNTAIGKARRSFLEQDRARRYVNIIDPGKPVFLIPKLLQEAVCNVWFGTGSSLKTYAALRVGVSVALGKPFLGLPVRKGGVLLVDYENHEGNFKFRLNRILRGMKEPLELDYDLEHWDAQGIPLVDQIEAIKAKVVNSGISLIIIDSAAAACGGKPEDADVTLRFFRALGKLGAEVTILVIAHVPKGSDEMNPFGSIFWTNQPRRTVNFARSDDEDSDDMDLGIFFRKVNEGKKPRAMAFHVKFDGEDGPVTVESTDIRETDLEVKMHLNSRIWNALNVPRTVVDIVELLNDPKVTSESVSATLRCNKGMFERVDAPGTGGRGIQTVWQRARKANQ